jgi:hypothetical protein
MSYRKLSTHNIIVNVRYSRLYESAVRATQKSLKLNSDCGGTGSKKFK